MKRLYYLIFLTFFIDILGLRLAYSQSSSTEAMRPVLMSTPQTPEASALMKEINYPIDYSSGLPEIKIPIYEITSGDLKLPIYISFHASGLKVSEVPGPLGVNWSLHTSLSIIRNVNGVDDYNGYLSASNSLPHYEADRSLHMHAIHARFGVVDEQPDDFYYTLLNSSGRFAFKRKCPTCPDFDAITFPYRPEHKVIRVGNTAFKMIDEAGITYTFDQINRRADGSEIVEYKCSSIISATGADTISFSYVNGPPQAVTSVRHNDYARLIYPEPLRAQRMGGMLFQHNIMRKLETAPNHQIVLGSYVPGGWTEPPRMDLIDFPRVLNTIYFGGGSMTIIGQYNNITGIDIRDKAGVLVKQILFVKELLPANSDRKVLKTMTVTAPGEIDQVYRFTYYDPKGAANHEPRFDHWGYYNGKGPMDPSVLGTMRSIPTLTLPLNIFSAFSSGILDTLKLPGADKEPYLQGTQAYMLESITYPTNGKTVFEYELNKYLVYNNQLKNAGGLRIKRIKSQPKAGGASFEIIRKFIYGENENNAGFLTGNPSADDYMTKTLIFNPVIGPNGLEVDMTVDMSKTWFNTPKVDLLHSLGSSVRYPCVTEYVEDEMGHALGKTVYKYDVGSVASRPYWAVQNVALTSFKNDSWLVGQLREKSIYSADLSQYRLVQKKTYDYKYKDYYEKWIPIKLKGSFGQLAPFYEQSLSFFHYHGDKFTYIVPAEEMTGVKLLESEQTIDYDQKTGKETVNKVEYKYEGTGHDFSTTIIHSQSDSSTISVINRYVNDANITPLITKNYLQPIVEQRYEWSKGNRKVSRGGLLTTYRVSSAGYVLLDKIYKYDKASSVIPNYVYGATIHPTYKLQTSYTKYTVKGRLLEFKKLNLPVTTILWGNWDLYPRITVENATSSQVNALLGPDTTKIGSSTMSDNDFYNIVSRLRNHTNMNNAMVTAYTYKPLVGMTSQTGPDGSTEYYKYDNFGRLNYISDFASNIVKSYQYNYGDGSGSTAPAFFSNIAKSDVFLKNNCSAGQQGGWITYTVPAGKLISYISQQDADKKAEEDVARFGQDYANSNGLCYPPLLAGVGMYGTVGGPLMLEFTPVGGTKKIIQSTSTHLNFLLPRGMYNIRFSVQASGTLLTKAVVNGVTVLFSASSSNPGILVATINNFQVTNNFDVSFY